MRLLPAVTLVALLVTGCRTVAPLSPADFARPLERTFLRASNPDLNDAAFDAKWEEGKADPISFFRGFPGAFHADLARVPESRFPGGEVLCAGDAHPENFGFMRVNGRTVYALNDFDDCGYCPAANDALRYFTVLRLGGSDAWVDELLGVFVNVVRGASRVTPVEESHSPDWDTLRAKALGKSTVGEVINLASDKSLAAPSPEKRAAIVHALLAREPSLKILDVATYTRVSGGSGGLARYWVLAELEGGRTILELKQTVAPGAEQGRHSRVMEIEHRLAELQRAFWSDVSRSDYYDVVIDGARYLVRDRLTKAPLWLTDLSREQLKAVLVTQAGLLGELTAPGLNRVPPEELTRWLRESSETLAARWRAVLR